MNGEDKDPTERIKANLDKWTAQRYYGRDCHWRTLKDWNSGSAQERLEAVCGDLPGTLKQCGVPEHWRGASLDNCPDLPEPLINECRTWAEAPDGFLYLNGPPGAGKSWMAVGLLVAIIKDAFLCPRECRYLGERYFLEALKAGFDRHNGAAASPAQA